MPVLLHRNNDAPMNLRTGLVRLCGAFDDELAEEHKIGAQGFVVDRFVPVRLHFVQPKRTEIKMDRTAFLNDLQDKLSALLAQSPAADLERNIKAMVAQGLARFELVTREEFEVQRESLLRMRQRVTDLETRVQTLEARSPESGDAA